MRVVGSEVEVRCPISTLPLHYFLHPFSLSFDIYVISDFTFAFSSDLFLLRAGRGRNTSPASSYLRFQQCSAGAFYLSILCETWVG